MDNFFECPGKMFLSTEKVFKKISEDQPLMDCLIVFSTFYRKKCHIFIELEKYSKTKLALNSSQSFKAMV